MPGNLDPNERGMVVYLLSDMPRGADHFLVLKYLEGMSGEEPDTISPPHSLVDTNEYEIRISVHPPSPSLKSPLNEKGVVVCPPSYMPRGADHL